MKKIIGLLILILVFVAGCTTQPADDKAQNGLYEDATVELLHYGGFVMQEMAYQKLTITKTKAVYESFGPDWQLTHRNEISLSDDEYKEIIDALTKADFFSLEDAYDPALPVADVGMANLTVNTDEDRKTIHIAQYMPEELPRDLRRLVLKVQDVMNRAGETPAILLTFQPMQCVEPPWSTEKDTEEPPWRDQDWIKVYYERKGADVITVEKVMLEEAVCEACETCPEPHYFEAVVNRGDADILREDGWS